MNYYKAALKLIRNQEALAMIEFAIALPFFLMLFLGGAEISRLLLINQKLDRAAYVASQLVSQYEPATSAGKSREISVSNLTNSVLPAIKRMLEEDSQNIDQDVAATFTAVDADGKIAWQYAFPGGNRVNSDNESKSIVNGRKPLAIQSKGIKLRGDNADFPHEIEDILETIPGYDSGHSSDAPTLLVTELFFVYRPFLEDVLNGAITVPTTVYSRRVFSYPRRGNLEDLPPVFPVN